jgi:hypothetical protein
MERFLETRSQFLIALQVKRARPTIHDYFSAGHIGLVEHCQAYAFGIFCVSDPLASRFQEGDLIIRLLF